MIMSDIKYFGGIDIGKEGAISIVSYSDKKIIPAFFIEMPESNKELLKKLRYIKSKFPLDEICIEKQVYMSRGNYSRQSGKGAFTLGHSQGLIEGILMTLDINYSVIAPRTWQSIIKDIKVSNNVNELCKSSKKISSKISKQKSLSLCEEIFPKVPLVTKRGRILDGIADSLCISYWKYKTML